MKEISLDDILMWEYFERPARVRKIKTMFIILVGLAFAFILSFVFMAFRTLMVPMVVLCILEISAFSWMYKIHVWVELDNKYRKSLVRKADKVPTQILNLALKLEKNYWTALLWAVECYESHIPGDCPLCGAE